VKYKIHGGEAMEVRRILKSFLLMALCFFIFPSFTFAENNAGSVIDTFNFKAGADFRYLDYDTSDSNEEFDGPMFGVAGDFFYHGISNMDNYLMAGIELEVLGGSLDSDGQNIGGSIDGSDDFLIETRGLVGYDYFTDNSNLITPFTGIGYRYWNNDIDGSGGFKREVQYWYAPIGIKSLGSLAENWTGGITAEYDLFLGGTVKSHLSDIDSRYNDPEVDQDPFDGHGFRFSVHLTREFEERGHSLTFEPYIRYWDLDKSGTKAVTGASIDSFEPENETLSYGIRLSLSF